jgi:hypothetical protein
MLTILSTSIVMFIPLITENLIIICLIILFQNIGCSIMLILSFQYARTFSPPEFKNRAVAYVNLGYPITSLLYVTFIWNWGYWKHTLVIFNGFQGLLLFSGFYYFSPESKMN